MTGTPGAFQQGGRLVIDTYFKQHFWSFHLLALAVAAYLAANAANIFIREALRPPPTAQAAGADKGERKQDAKKSLVAVTEFLNRNMFAAEREDLTPEPPKPDADAAAAAANAASMSSSNIDTSNCEKASMRATLVATVVSSDEEASVAVFQDPSKNRPEAYRIKEKLLGQAEVIAIDWRVVYVNNGGKCERFSIEDDAAPDKASRRPGLAKAPPAKGKKGAPKMDLGKGVKKIDDTNYEIPRGEIDNVLGNLNVVATQARIVPSFRNGKANGFKLFSIRPGSLYSKIGIQNGDVIQKINGYEINSPDKALEIYSKLKDANSITVDLVRRGRSKSLSYNIR